MSSTAAKRVPLRPIFRVGNNQKPLRARSGEYGGHFHVQVLQRLHDAVLRKRRDKWQSGFCITITHRATHCLLCSNSSPRKAFVIIQPLYSPDLAPSDFWLFPTLKVGLKGTRFTTMEDIKLNATAKLRKISNEAFCRCFQQQQERWSKCVCVRKGPTLKVIR